MKENLFHSTFENAAYFDIDNWILDGIEYDVSSIFYLTIQVMDFAFIMLLDKWEDLNIDSKH